MKKVCAPCVYRLHFKAGTPILQVDAIRFFRVQVSTALLRLSPHCPLSACQFGELTVNGRNQKGIAIIRPLLLVPHVDSDNHICYTRTIDIAYQEENASVVSLLSFFPPPLPFFSFWMGFD
jgi:hypothetical protein